LHPEVRPSISGEEYKLRPNSRKEVAFKDCLPFPHITDPPPMTEDIFAALMVILSHVRDRLSFIRRIFTISASYITYEWVH
jgi:hypothetical protein